MDDRWGFYGGISTAPGWFVNLESCSTRSVLQILRLAAHEVRQPIFPPLWSPESRRATHADILGAGMRSMPLTQRVTYNTTYATGRGQPKGQSQSTLVQRLTE